MLKAYAITVREILEKTVCVEAENLTEAFDKVESAYYDEKIILEPEDLSCREFNLSMYAGENGVVNEDELDEYKENYQWIGEK